jgi:hypothetical protein
MQGKKAVGSRDCGNWRKGPKWGSGGDENGMDWIGIYWQPPQNAMDKGRQRGNGGTEKWTIAQTFWDGIKKLNEFVGINGILELARKNLCARETQIWITFLYMFMCENVRKKIFRKLDGDYYFIIIGFWLKLDGRIMGENI